MYWSSGPGGEPILYNPGEKNSDDEGKPVDELGANVKYRCLVKHQTLSSKVIRRCEEILPNKKRCEATKKRQMG